MRIIYISCPASSRSGYGDHARDLIRSLIADENNEVNIIDQRWGNCPQNALGNKDTDISSRLVQGGVIKTKPDVWIQVTVPNEFNPIGTYNIGITAGMETTTVDPSWIEGCNRMDKVIVPSKHSKDVFMTCSYDKINKNTNAKEGTLKIEKPIEVLFEGLDLEVYHKTEDKSETVEDFMTDVKEDFCFLTVGHWLSGGFGHDRKDLATTIRTFLETFKGQSKKNRPGLILKTSGATYSVIDKQECLKKIREIIHHAGIDNPPSVYLLHGDLTMEDLNCLYNHKKVKAMFSLTHGEGFGRPLLEFSITGKPVIASNWSGHVDFLSEYGIMLAGKLETVHESAVWDKVILKESQWFYADPNYASRVLKEIHKNYKTHLVRTRKQTQYVKDNFTLEKMKTDFKTMIIESTKDIPSRVELKLPKLKLPKLEKQNG